MISSFSTNSKTCCNSSSQQKTWYTGGTTTSTTSYNQFIGQTIKIINKFKYISSFDNRRDIRG